MHRLLTNFVGTLAEVADAPRLIALKVLKKLDAKRSSQTLRAVFWTLANAGYSSECRILNEMGLLRIR